MMADDSCLVAVNLTKAQLEIRMTIGLRESHYHTKNFYTGIMSGGGALRQRRMPEQDGLQVQELLEIIKLSNYQIIVKGF